jgi:hypothetical protein
MGATSRCAWVVRVVCVRGLAGAVVIKQCNYLFYVNDMTCKLCMFLKRKRGQHIHWSEDSRLFNASWQERVQYIHWFEHSRQYIHDIFFYKYDALSNCHPQKWHPIKLFVKNGMAGANTCLSANWRGMKWLFRQLERREVTLCEMILGICHAALSARSFGGNSPPANSYSNMYFPPYNWWEVPPVRPFLTID